MNKILMIAKLLSDSPEFIDVSQKIKNKITRCTFYGRVYTDNDPVILKFRSCVERYINNRSNNARIRLARLQESRDI